MPLNWLYLFKVSYIDKFPGKLTGEYGQINVDITQLTGEYDQINDDITQDRQFNSYGLIPLYLSKPSHR